MKRLLTALTFSAFAVVGTSVHAETANPGLNLESAPASQVEVTQERGNDAREEAVRNLRYMWRGSMAIENTYVLMFFNNSRVSVDIVVRCYTRNGVSKDIRVGVVAGGSASVGFMEGWDGNFVPGEFVEVFYEGRNMGRIDAPVK
ncbi:MAG: hypothetical protein AAGC72_03795 [Planctomycetota bacterium]